MSIKLIALDLDGTTLNSKSEMTELTRQTLNRAVRKGIHVVIATGRVYCALPQDIENVSGIEYIITSNGAAMTKRKEQKLIYENCIGEGEIDKIHKLLSDHNFLVEVFVKGKAYAERCILENLEQVGISESSMRYMRKTRLPHENVLSLLFENRRHVENINVIFRNQSDRAAMKEELIRLDNVTVTSSVGHNLEIGGKTTSKADALSELCRRLGIQHDEIMACGDSHNDEAMLQLAGLPVAVGNAEASVKNIAKYVTETNDRDGVALAIRKLVLKV